MMVNSLQSIMKPTKINEQYNFQHCIYIHNFTPQKQLNWKTPVEVFYDESSRERTHQELFHQKLLPYGCPVVYHRYPKRMGEPKGRNGYFIGFDYTIHELGYTIQDAKTGRVIRAGEAFPIKHIPLSEDEPLVDDISIDPELSNMELGIPTQLSDPESDVESSDTESDNSSQSSEIVPNQPQPSIIPSEILNAVPPPENAFKCAYINQYYAQLKEVMNLRSDPKYDPKQKFLSIAFTPYTNPEFIKKTLAQLQERFAGDIELINP